MDKETDRKMIVMHVLISETKGRTASQANFASQHVSEYFTAQGHIKKYYSTGTIPDVIQHLFASPQKSFSCALGETGKKKHLRQCFNPPSSSAAYAGVESLMMLLLTAARHYNLQNCHNIYNRLNR